MDSEKDILLSLKEVAQRLGISRRTLERLIAAGDINIPVKVGRCSRLFESDLMEYLTKLRERRRKI